MSRITVHEADDGDVVVHHRWIPGGEGQVELEVGGWSFTEHHFREYVSGEPERAVAEMTEAITGLEAALRESRKALEEWRDRRGWED